MNYKVREIYVDKSIKGVRVDKHNSDYYEKNPVEQFYRVEIDDGTQTSVRLVDDIYMLLNQQRLDRMTLQAFSNYINDCVSHQSVDGLAELRSKCSDADLLSFCKSRYIQSPCDLVRWSSYLEAETQRRLDYAISQQEAKEAAEQAAEQAAAQSSESSQTSE